MRKDGKMRLVLLTVAGEPKVIEMPVEHTYLDIKEAIGIDSPLDCVSRVIGKGRYDLWVDDEGLLKDGKCICALCVNADEILCGDILIAKHDGMGNTIGLTDEEIAEVTSKRNYIVKSDLVLHNKANGTPLAKMRDGKLLAEADHVGLGPVFMEEDGWMLMYRV